MADALRRDALDIQRSNGLPLRLQQRFTSWLWFEHYYAAAPWTLPSTTSLFTGADGVRHGHWSHDHELSVPSLVSDFRDRRRVAIVNNPAVGLTSGLNAGFDEYSFVANPAEFWHRSNEILQERIAAREPYFFVMHSNVVHDYYLPIARSYFERHVGAAEQHGYFDIRRSVIDWAGIGPRQRPVVRRIYDACVMELDERVDELLGAVDLERTLVAFLADHGEGFEPELGRIHHGGRVHDDVLRAPFVLHVPSTVPRDVRETLEAARSHTVGTVDVLPTLLALAGDQSDAPDGRSITGAARIAGHRRILRAEDERYLYLANRLRLNSSMTGKNLGKWGRLRNRAWHRTLARSHRIRAYVDEPYKLIVSELRTRNRWLARALSFFLARRHVGAPIAVVECERWFGVELFDRAADPGERDNLLRSRPEALAALRLADAYDAGDNARSLATLVSRESTR